MVKARSISVPGDASAWEGLGFTVAGGTVQIGGVRLALGAAAIEVAADGLGAERPDGLALVHARGDAAGPAPQHPNGAIVLDHVVAITDDMERTLAALEAAGLELRRRAGPMAFLRLGELILEVVERPGAGAAPGGLEPPGGGAAPGLVGRAAFWGLVVVVPDLDGLGPLAGDAKDAVQPGRRIATVRREAGIGAALAFMTPRPQPSRRG